MSWDINASIYTTNGWQNYAALSCTLHRARVWAWPLLTDELPIALEIVHLAVHRPRREEVYVLHLDGPPPGQSALHRSIIPGPWLHLTGTQATYASQMLARASDREAVEAYPVVTHDDLPMSPGVRPHRPRQVANAYAQRADEDIPAYLWTVHLAAASTTPLAVLIRPPAPLTPGLLCPVATRSDKTLEIPDLPPPPGPIFGEARPPAAMPWAKRPRRP